MNPHVSENLSRLLTGEASREETLAAARHLRGCPDCQQELVSAVVAHAALTSAQRFAPDVVAPEVSPDSDRAAASATREPDRSVAALPDLSPMFAKVRAEATQRPGRLAASPRRRWLAIAAAAVVLAGGGAAAAQLLGGTTSHSVAQTVTLRPVGTARAAVIATISHGSMHVDATTLPKLQSSRQYEVWLVAAGGHQLRPIGYVGADRTATLPVAQQVMSRYDAIAISVQRAGQVEFSGHIVVRGRYA